MRVLSHTELEAFLQRWLDAFGRNRHGVNSKAYLWHIFSAERHPAIAGPEALAAYAEAVAPLYVVLSNDRDEGFVTEVRPTACSLSDYYVFPENLAWTMAFTHEDGWLGPYFARHADFSRLQAENVQSLKKAAEASIARSKGWA